MYWSILTDEETFVGSGTLRVHHGVASLLPPARPHEVATYRLLPLY
jgi:hypothetical protein